jgi:hypothetical protein
MVNAPDFDRSMLLLATQLSHESEMKSLLLVVLETLLNSLKTRDSSDMIIEGITLTRCIVRLVSRLLAEPAANKYEHDLGLLRPSNLFSHLQTRLNQHSDQTLSIRWVVTHLF